MFIPSTLLYLVLFALPVLLRVLFWSKWFVYYFWAHSNLDMSSLSNCPRKSDFYPHTLLSTPWGFARSLVHPNPSTISPFFLPALKLPTAPHRKTSFSHPSHSLLSQPKFSTILTLCPQDPSFRGREYTKLLSLGIPILHAYTGMRAGKDRYN